jgi:hypothetical protein
MVGTPSTWLPWLFAREAVGLSTELDFDAIPVRADLPAELQWEIAYRKPRPPATSRSPDLPRSRRRTSLCSPLS